MSADRPVAAGVRRIDDAARESGLPVRPGPVVVGALSGGMLGAWIGGVPAKLLALVASGLATSGSSAAVDGAGAIRELVVKAGSACWLPLAAGAAGAVAGVLVQTGGRIRSVSPRLPRPRLAGAADAVGAGSRTAASLVVLGAAAGAGIADWPALSRLPALPLRSALDAAAGVAGDVVIAAVAAAAAVAALDVAAARWRWSRSLRMTVQEAKEERRRSEGDPSLRSIRRAQARRIAGSARGKVIRGQAA